MKLSERLRKAHWDDVDGIVDEDWADEVEQLEAENERLVEIAKDALRYVGVLSIMVEGIVTAMGEARDALKDA